MPNWDEDSPQLRENLAKILAEIVRDAELREPPSRETAREWQALFMKGLDVPDARFTGVHPSWPRRSACLTCFPSVSEGNGKSKGDERENESNQDFHSEISLSVCGDWRNLTGGGAWGTFVSRSLPRGSVYFPLKRSIGLVRKVQMVPLVEPRPPDGGIGNLPKAEGGYADTE